MKRKTICLIVSFLLLTGTVASFSSVTYAVLERNLKVSGTDGANIPFITDGYRNVNVYVIPTAWNSLLSGNSSVGNCYIAACMWRNDDETKYEWQFIKTCDSEKAVITENQRSITISATSYTTYRFELDLTYYDRLSFHRIGYTTNLQSYIGDAPNTYVSKSTDLSPVPIDWRDRDQDPNYRRYDATHRQTKPTNSNVFEITSTNSGGDYGFLAWGEWYDDAIITTDADVE